MERSGPRLRSQVWMLRLLSELFFRGPGTVPFAPVIPLSERHPSFLRPPREDPPPRGPHPPPPCGEPASLFFYPQPRLRRMPASPNPNPSTGTFGMGNRAPPPLAARAFERLTLRLFLCSPVTAQGFELSPPPLFPGKTPPTEAGVLEGWLPRQHPFFNAPCLWLVVGSVSYRLGWTSF